MWNKAAAMVSAGTTAYKPEDRSSTSSLKDPLEDSEARSIFGAVLSTLAGKDNKALNVKEMKTISVAQRSSFNRG